METVSSPLAFSSSNTAKVTSFSFTPKVIGHTVSPSGSGALSSQTTSPFAYQMVINSAGLWFESVTFPTNIEAKPSSTSIPSSCEIIIALGVGF